MSLKVWLPLNGDLRNLGTTDFTYTTSIIGGYEPGKIGQALSLLNSQLIFTIPTLSGVTKFSIAFWYKPRTNTTLTGNWYNIIALMAQSADGSASAAWRCESSYNNAYAISHHNNVGSPIDGDHNQLATEKDIWYHICLTCDGINSTKAYVNGVIRSTKQYQGGHLTGRVGIADETSKPDGLLNDVRIYDHCLSAAEVHEIAQGLILHYKLNNNINLGNNLLPNSLEMNLGSANASTGTWRIAGTSNMSRERVAITDTPEGSGYGFQNSGIQTANDGSCYGIDKFPLEPNTVYIISIWARIIEGTEGYAGFNIYSSTPINGWSKIERNYYLTQLSPQGEWTKCYIAFMTNASTTRNIYIGITTGDTSVTTQMCNVHIEKGIIEDKVITDSSGYGHNAILQEGSLSSIANTIRYNSSVFSEETTCCKIQDTIFDSQHLASEFTWSGWIKRGYTAAEARYIYKGIVYIYLGDEFDIRIGWRHQNEDGSYDSNNAWAPGIIIPYNEWTHITFTFKDGIMKLYINGEYIRMSDRSETGIYIRGYRNFYFLSNSGDSFVGNISDMRVYCTALLDKDIKLLYNVSNRIDNLGGVHSFEFNETTNEKILKSGVLQTNELEETSVQLAKLKKNKGWLSSEFIEI